MAARQAVLQEAEAAFDPLPVDAAAARAFGSEDHGEFRDPDLVPVYDVLCPWSRDDDFFLAVARAKPGAGQVTWIDGTSSDSQPPVTLADGSQVVTWTELTAVDDGTVSVAHEYRFPDGTARRATATMRFRTEQEVRSSLRTAGFTVEHVYGGWNRESAEAGDGKLLVLART